MRVFLIAGEASGDKLGGALMAGLRSLRPDVHFSGVGGALMQAEGMDSLFEMSELSVMGLAEVLPKYRHLKRRIAQTAQAVIAARPDVLITIDSPDFCLRVAKSVKAAAPIRVVHYVAPSVWAWRPGRAAKMAPLVDQVLALLPFEPRFMHAAGIACDFVGHPVVAEPVATLAEQTALRQALGVGQAQPLILALPGSRAGEVARMAPRFGEALTPVLRAHPNARVLVPAARSVVDAVRSHVQTWPGDPIVLDPSGQDTAAAEDAKRTAFAAADVALATSGTVALELAAAGTPMVSAFDLNPISRMLVSWLIRRHQGGLVTPTRGNLINIVTQSDIVPELIGAACTPAALAQALSQVIAAPDAQQAAMGEVMQALGRGGEAPGLRAARAVLARMPQQTG
ncbi:MAG: lipid-A-disaccharide synthase [Pseudomonadota bacterium]